MSEVFGSYLVTPTGTALTKAWKLCDSKCKPFHQLRRQTLKLAYWPGGDSGGADIDWDWIKGLEAHRIGELRIDETINGHDNVRVIFFKANELKDDEQLLRIWLLTVFAKKRWELTTPQMKAWSAMKQIVVHRVYGGSNLA